MSQKIYVNKNEPTVTINESIANVSVKTDSGDTIIVTHETTNVVEVAAFGPRGPRGEQGPQGVTGTFSASGSVELDNLFASGSITANLAISSSDYVYAKGVFINSGSRTTNDFFLIRSESFAALRVNGEGVLQLGAFTIEPTPELGGIYYNNNTDEYYVSKRTS
jgi:hypothetical protein